MFCTYCGTKLDDDSRFCYNCGNKVMELEMNLPSSNDASIKEEVLDNEAETGIVEEEAVIGESEAELAVEEVMATEHEITERKSQPSVQFEQPQPTQSVQPQQAQVIQSNPTYQPPLSIPQGKKKKEKKVSEGKKRRKGLLAAIIILMVLVLGAGGYFIYTKITLGNLSDSVAAFKTLVQESGLENIEEYASLIEDAENKSNSLLVFGASDLEDKLKKATEDCIQLSDDLLALKEQRETYENLDYTLIVDSNTDANIRDLLSQFDLAIQEGEKETAEDILSSLEEQRQMIITDNQIYVSSLLDEVRNYENEEFNEEDYNTLYNQITIAENYITAHDFVHAKEQALSLSVLISEIETRIYMEKEAAALAELMEKPEKLVVMVPEVIYTESDYRQQFEVALEEKLGIDIVFDISSNSSYYDAVDVALSSGTLPDVVYLTQNMYKEYAAKGYLADITEYWESSDLRYSKNFTGEAAIQRLKIDDHLYGFTPVRGYTNVTYVRKSWLDQLGLQAPTNYEQFEAMLKAFTENKMGNTKKASDTYGMTAPGLLYGSEPYISYLQQFYQNANVEIYQNYSGEWVDGFTQPEMVEALNRLQTAYALGYLDPDIADNTITDAIEAFGKGECGVISLWEGEGADYLIAELAKNGIEDELIVLDPLIEMGSYIGKEPAVLAVTTSCKNPGGVVEYFFKPMLDGGDVQRLWTYGVQGVHWNDIAETVQYTDDLIVDYQEGEFHNLPYSSISFVTYNYNFIDPLLALASIESGANGMNAISEIAKTSSEVANAYYQASPNVKYNEKYWYYFGDIYNYRLEAIHKIVLEGSDVTTTIAEYQKNVELMMGLVLSDLNDN